MAKIHSLKPGSLIEVELLRIGESTKLKTVIDTGLEDNTLTILTPMDKGKTVPLHIDERLKIIYIVESGDNGSDVYSFKAKVIGRATKGNVQVTKIVKTGQPEKVQRREFFRLGLVKSLDIEFEGKHISMLTKDISGGGMRGYCNSRIPAQSNVTVHLPMNTGELVSISGLVIDSSPVNQSNTKFDVRVTFSNISQKEKSSLISYIYSKQTEVLKGQLKSKLGNEYAIDEGQFGSYYSMSFGTRVLSLLPLINWFFTLYMVTIVFQAKPATHGGVAERFGIYIAKFWNLQVLQRSLPWAVAIITLSVVGILLKSTNEHDQISKNPYNYIAQIVISSIVIAFYFIMITVTAS